MTLPAVIPAEAGIQDLLNGSLLSQGRRLDSRSPIKQFEDKFHGNDVFFSASHSFLNSIF
jgi:hypothetical protein